MFSKPPRGSKATSPRPVFDDVLCCTTAYMILSDPKTERGIYLLTTPQLIFPAQTFLRAPGLYVQIYLTSLFGHDPAI